MVERSTKPAITDSARTGQFAITNLGASHRKALPVQVVPVGFRLGRSYH